MSKPANYNVEIAYEPHGTTDERIAFAVTMPDGTQQTATKCGYSHSYKGSGGVHTVGETWYELNTATGPARFETFDDLMQKGLGLTRENA